MGRHGEFWVVGEVERGRAKRGRLEREEGFILVVIVKNKANFAITAFQTRGLRC